MEPVEASLPIQLHWVRHHSVLPSYPNRLHSSWASSIDGLDWEEGDYDMSGLVDHRIPSATASVEACLAYLQIALTGQAYPPSPTPSHQGATSWFQSVVASVEEPHTSSAHHRTEGTGGGGPWDARTLGVEGGAAAVGDDAVDGPRYDARGGE